MGTGLRSSRVRRLSRTLAPVVVIVIVSLQLSLQWGRTVAPAHAQQVERPNVVVILTDDQRFDTLKVMPIVGRELLRQGMHLRRAIVTNPLCCPSRATILTGRYSHTTGVYTNTPPTGAWPAFQPSEPDTIATALDAAGYRTALIGKYLNGYTEDVYVPPGWDRFFALVEPSKYYDYEVLDQARGLLSFGSASRDYSTDVFRRRAVRFIRDTPTDQPFFLLVTPFAPHAPSIAAPRHERDFARSDVVLNPAVNEEDVSDKPSYLAGRATVDPAKIRAQIRNQWESLLAVDELVGALTKALAATGRAEETLVIFTSDNGFATREHRWSGKRIPHDVSIRVPMIVRYPPEIPAGTASNALVSNVDLAPTIADFAGVPFTADGVSLRPLLTDAASAARSSVVLENVDEPPQHVPTYCGVRTPGFTFVHYATGEEELYDLGSDPWQLRNVAAARPNKATELRTFTESLCTPTPPGFSW